MLFYLLLLLVTFSVNNATKDGYNNNNNATEGGAETTTSSVLDEIQGEIGRMNDFCYYAELQFIEAKVPLILGFATSVSCLSIVSNTLLSYIFVTRPTFIITRHSHLFFLAILGFLDIWMGSSYIALMSVPVLFDVTGSLTMFHAWLAYVRPVLAISNSLITMSTYLIVFATLERFLRSIATAKGTTFWEVEVVRNSMCEGFAEYYLQSSRPIYGTRIFHFYLRSVCQGFIPFFLLVWMTSIIIWNHGRVHSQTRTAETISLNSRSPDSPTLTGTNHSSDHHAVSKHSVRDATRMLVACVTMYLVTNSLSLFITIWEYVDKESLFNHYTFYTFANDVISILPILSGFLRPPIYCLCNLEIRKAFKNLTCRFSSSNMIFYLLLLMATVTANNATDDVYNGTISVEDEFQEELWRINELWGELENMSLNPENDCGLTEAHLETSNGIKDSFIACLNDVQELDEIDNCRKEAMEEINSFPQEFQTVFYCGARVASVPT